MKAWLLVAGMVVVVLFALCYSMFREALEVAALWRIFTF